MYMVVVVSFPLFLVLVLVVFLWSPKRRDNKTQRRPQEHKQDKNKEEWKRNNYNHLLECGRTFSGFLG